jgi:predicted nucleotide-binding protein
LVRMKPILLTLDRIENAIEALENGIRRKKLIQTIDAYRRLKEWIEHLKNLLPNEFVNEIFENFDRHLHFINYYVERKDFTMIKSNFDDIKKKDFPEIKSKIIDFIESKKQVIQKSTQKLSNKIFIVHGRAPRAIKELKAILKEMELEPIVLHEKASGSRTIIEKLEKHSDVGFAFVLLTPDDAGYCQFERRVLSDDYAVKIRPTLKRLRSLSEKEHETTVSELMKVFVKILRGRARQNVVLEFGYFIGRLGRDRVCCLHKGDVELPSDMKGIVYIHFDKTLDECRNRIVEELKEAGYKVDS